MFAFVCFDKYIEDFKLVFLGRMRLCIPERFHTGKCMLIIGLRSYRFNIHIVLASILSYWVCVPTKRINNFFPRKRTSTMSRKLLPLILNTTLSLPTILAEG